MGSGYRGVLMFSGTWYLPFPLTIRLKVQH